MNAKTLTLRYGKNVKDIEKLIEEDKKELKAMGFTHITRSETTQQYMVVAKVLEGEIL